MEKPALVVLAAGMGSRYGGLKQLDGLGPGGEVLMEYSVFDALKAGFSKVVFIIRHDIEAAFREYVLSRFPEDLPWSFVYQELDALPKGIPFQGHRSKPWGTTHALWCARDAVSGPFAVLNADDFYGASGFQKLVAFFENQETTAKTLTGALVGYRLGKTLSESGSVARGICQADGLGNLTFIEEKTDIQVVEGSLVCDLEAGSPTQLSGSELVSMNFWGFTPEVFSLLDAEIQNWFAQNYHEPKTEILLPTTIGKLVREGKIQIKVLDSEDGWIGVTYADDKGPTRQKLESLHAQEFYPKKLWERG
jgi:NDP-sugar pyrophosphorylase family protein